MSDVSKMAAPDAPCVFPCVCGEQVPVRQTPAEGLTCPHCGRTIAAGMLAQSMLSLGATIIGAGDTDVGPQLLLEPGDKLDHFTVIDQLGAGGMGAVFRARDESLQRYVALKVIRSRPGEAERLWRDRLIQEARAQARVSHANVVHIYYVGTHNDCPFFAMEYVPGHSLAWVIRQRRLTFPEVVQIGLQTAEALSHSASLSIVHGDVKPGNILLDSAGNVKLSDFGLAGCPEAASASGISTTGPAGTLNYMAPEVAAGQSASIHSDMYSLGVMLYELTLGELPHQASSDSLEENLRQRQTATIRFPSAWPPDRPERWKEFLAACLHRDPAARFPDYQSLIRELSCWQPVPLNRAGRFPRFLAWFTDMILFGLAPALTGGLALLAGLSTSTPHLATLYYWMTIIPIGLLMWRRMMKTQSTPGKRLLQLRYVDAYGLPPTRWKLRLAILGTFLIFLTSAVGPEVNSTDGNGIATVAGLAFAGRILRLIAGIWILINGVWLVFSRRGQALVDRLLGIYVVLDSGRAHARAAAKP